MLPQIISLDGEWQFTYQPNLKPGHRIPALPPARRFTARMRVPGYWDDHLKLMQIDNCRAARFNPDYRPLDFPMGERPPSASLPYLLGVGWYRREFTAPAADKAHATTLVVGGVVMETWIWLNGHYLGHYLGHSTPFEISLDRRMQWGTANTLTMAVSNLREDRTGCVIRGYAGRSGGIYRSVRVKIAGRTGIRSLYLRAGETNRTIVWQVELTSKPAGGQGLLNYELKDHVTGSVVQRGSTAASRPCVRWITPSRGIRPWSDHEPKLYEARVSLIQDGRVCDRITQTFGLRRLERKGMELRLNGRPIWLRGATEHAYFPLTCTPPTDITAYRRILGTLKALGFNWLRFHTWVPSEEYMTAADELGIMIQVEPPLGFGRREWIDILQSCRKHPSVVIYCCGNEELLDEAKLRFLRRMSALQRTLAPDALFNPQEALRGIEYGPLSVLGKDYKEKPYLHNPRRLREIKRFSDVFGQYSWGHLSYKTVFGNWRVVYRLLKAYERPCLSHEMGIHGNYLNLDLEPRYAGTRIGTDLFASVRRNLAAAGLVEKAAVYYRNSCAWMRILRKHNLETARRCRRLAGYDFLGAWDHHWHRSGYPCGIMNEFFELKPGESAAEVLRYNGESVLLLDHGNHRNYTAGDRFQADVLVSYYGINPLKQGTLTWSLARQDGTVMRQGRWTVKSVRPGTIRSLGVVRLTLPETRQGDHLILRARLTAKTCAIDNEWHFWVFPVPAAAWPESIAADRILRSRWQAVYPGINRPLPPSDKPAICLVSALADDSVAQLVAGGTLVLLGHAPLPALPTSFQMARAGRARENLATVIADHPLMNAFPHEGFCDWQFYPMLEEGQAVVFDDLSIPFDPIIDVVSSFKIIVKQAAVFECRLGQGRLLACSLNLDPSDAGSRFLFERILRYVRSERFAPRTAANPARFAACLRGKTKVGANFTTDMAYDAQGQLKRKTDRKKG